MDRISLLLSLSRAPENVMGVLKLQGSKKRSMRASK